MLYRHGEWKGTQDGIEALRLAKLKVPSMKVYLFGTEKKAHIEPWMEYHLNPSQELIVELYNKAAIFVGPSWSEGWGLPGCEAALCGCALAMTDNGGHREYAIHMETALLSEIKNPIALAENIVTLLQNNELRIKIAKQAQKHILQFDWEEAIQKFIKILK
jgi:glycosyltransferase involved in cell wall biosynthesis